MGEEGPLSATGRVIDGAVGASCDRGRYADEHTAESRNRSKANRAASGQTPEQPQPAPPKGASDGDAGQRDREKRIERFRER